jgi:hypothetical protein
MSEVIDLKLHIRYLYRLLDSAEIDHKKIDLMVKTHEEIPLQNLNINEEYVQSIFDTHYSTDIFYGGVESLSKFIYDHLLSYQNEVLYRPESKDKTSYYYYKDSVRVKDFRGKILLEAVCPAALKAVKRLYKSEMQRYEEIDVDEKEITNLVNIYIELTRVINRDRTKLLSSIPW